MASLRRILPALVGAGLLAGCGTVDAVKAQRDAGPGALCADFMRRALPGADIAVTKTRVATPAIAGVVVTVEGTRPDVAPSAMVNRDVAAECRFDHDALIEFRWTTPPFK